MAANIILNRSVQCVSRFLMDTVMTTFKDRGAFTRTTSRWNGEPEQPRLLRPTSLANSGPNASYSRPEAIFCVPSTHHTLRHHSEMGHSCTRQAVLMTHRPGTQSPQENYISEIREMNTQTRAGLLSDAFGLSCSHLSTICRFCITTVPHPGFLLSTTKRG